MEPDDLFIAIHQVQWGEEGVQLGALCDNDMTSSTSLDKANRTAACELPGILVLCCVCVLLHLVSKFLATPPVVPFLSHGAS